MQLSRCVWLRRRALGVVLAWSLAGACGFGATAPHPTAAAKSPLAATLTPLVEQTMRELRVPGAIVGVVVPGQGTWMQAFGVSDLKTRAPMRAGEHTRIGSITKTFTGTVVLTLVDEGKLSLDDSLSRFEPAVQGAAAITVREMLNMTSGLYNYSEDPGFNASLDSQPDRIWSPAELVAISGRHPPDFPPGQGWHYSNTNTVLLGMIAEKVAGRPLSALMQERIFRPLSLRRTVFPERTSSAIPDPHPRGYMFGTNVESLSPSPPPVPLSEPPSDVTSANPSWGWAAGAGISTTSDLLRWAPALAKGTLLKPATQAQRLQWVGGGGAKYGLAIFDVQGYLGHNGELPGFQSFMGYNPANGVTLVVLTNLTAGPQPERPGPADTIARAILPKLS
jgi:D-alanyl-D-alanine carboxypeptidase